MQRILTKDLLSQLCSTGLTWSQVGRGRSSARTPFDATRCSSDLILSMIPRNEERATFKDSSDAMIGLTPATCSNASFAASESA